MSYSIPTACKSSAMLVTDLRTNRNVDSFMAVIDDKNYGSKFIVTFSYDINARAF